MNRKDSIGRWISVLYRYTHTYISKELEPYNIGSGQFQILIVLNRKDGINQETIAKILNLDKANVGRAVNKLMKSGYVKRSINPSDHRAYLIRMTPKGQNIIPEIRKVLTNVSKKILIDFSNEEKKVAFQLLERMYQNLTMQDDSN